MSQSIYFFATKDDCSALLEATEGRLAVDYVRCDHHPAPPARIETFQKFTDFGYAAGRGVSLDNRYLCLPLDAKLQLRTITYRNGDIVHIVDQLLIRDSIVLQLGGKFGDNTIISGEISTISDTKWSLQTFSVFKKEFRKQFCRIQEFYVGKEARSLLDQGWRLTQDCSAPVECDLTIS